MIHSSGQIITGKFKNATASVILNKKDEKGFYRAHYKALVVDTTTGASEDPDTYGFWVKVADDTATAKDFVGVVGSDTYPQANVDILNDNKPYCSYGNDYNVPAGGLVTIERNGIIRVIANEKIAPGDLIAIGGENGSFKKATDLTDAVGRAVTGAEKKDDGFQAYIGSY